MEDEGKWEGPFEPGDPDGPALTNREYQSNTVNLCTDGTEICAMIGPDPVQGICGYGASVHDALRDLADNLLKCGVWIEVTDPEISPRDGVSRLELRRFFPARDRCPMATSIVEEISQIKWRPGVSRIGCDREPEDMNLLESRGKTVVGGNFLCERMPLSNTDCIERLVTDPRRGVGDERDRTIGGV